MSGVLVIREQCHQGVTTRADHRPSADVHTTGMRFLPTGLGQPDTSGVAVDGPGSDELQRRLRAVGIVAVVPDGQSQTLVSTPAYESREGITDLERATVRQ